MPAMVQFGSQNNLRRFSRAGIGRFQPGSPLDVLLVGLGVRSAQSRQEQNNDCPQRFHLCGAFLDEGFLGAGVGAEPETFTSQAAETEFGGSHVDWLQAW